MCSELVAVIVVVVVVVLLLHTRKERGFNEKGDYSLPYYIKKKGKYRIEDEKILMSFKKFNDSQKDNPCAASSYMEENSCK